MNECIDEYTKKTQRYYYDDGLVEMIIALLMAGLGAALVLILSVETSSPLIGAVLFPAITGAAIAASVILKRWVNKLKEQITYSRSGYVSYNQDEADHRRWFLLIFSMVLEVAVLFLLSEFDSIQFFFGSPLAAVLFYLGYRLALYRFYVTGSACFLIGAATAIWIDDEFFGTAVALAPCGFDLLL